MSTVSKEDHLSIDTSPSLKRGDSLFIAFACYPAETGSRGKGSSGRFISECPSVCFKDDKFLQGSQGHDPGCSLPRSRRPI